MKTRPLRSPGTISLSFPLPYVLVLLWVVNQSNLSLRLSSPSSHATSLLPLRHVWALLKQHICQIKLSIYITVRFSTKCPIPHKMLLCVDIIIFILMWSSSLHIHYIIFIFVEELRPLKPETVKLLRYRTTDVAQTDVRGKLRQSHP